MLKTPAARDLEPATIDPMLRDRMLGLRNRGSRPRIILAESHDERVLRAAGALAEVGVQPILIGDGNEVRNRARHLGITDADGWSVDDPARLAAGPAGERIRSSAERKRPELAEQWLTDPVFLAAAAVKEGLADAAVAGADRPTADVIRAGLSIVEIGRAHV